MLISGMRSKRMSSFSVKSGGQGVNPPFPSGRTTEAFCNPFFSFEIDIVYLQVLVFIFVQTARSAFRFFLAGTAYHLLKKAVLIQYCAKLVAVDIRWQIKNPAISFFEFHTHMKNSFLAALAESAVIANIASGFPAQFGFTFGTLTDKSFCR